MSNFSNVYPNVSTQMFNLRQSMDKACRQAIIDLMTAFFQDYNHVRSVSWQQTVAADGTLSVGGMSIDYSLMPVADDAQLLADLGNLNDFLVSIHYHLRCAFGTGMTVKFDRNGHSVAKI